MKDLQKRWVCTDAQCDFTIIQDDEPELCPDCVERYGEDDSATCFLYSYKCPYCDMWMSTESDDPDDGWVCCDECGFQFETEWHEEVINNVRKHLEYYNKRMELRTPLAPTGEVGDIIVEVRRIISDEKWSESIKIVLLNHTEALRTAVAALQQKASHIESGWWETVTTEHAHMRDVEIPELQQENADLYAKCKIFCKPDGLIASGMVQIQAINKRLQQSEAEWRGLCEEFAKTAGIELASFPEDLSCPFCLCTIGDDDLCHNYPEKCPAVRARAKLEADNGSS